MVWRSYGYFLRPDQAASTRSVFQDDLLPQGGPQLCGKSPRHHTLASRAAPLGAAANGLNDGATLWRRRSQDGGFCTVALRA